MAEGQSPLTQFEIKNLVPVTLGENLDLSFTNSSLFMALSVLGIIVFFMQAMRRRSLIPGRMQCAAEMVYETIADMLKDIVGDEGKKFFPLVFSVFLFILVCNLFGMLPGAFTVTSHVSVTFGLAAALFIAINIYGIIRHGLHFFSLFIPKGVPVIMYPILVPLEVFSYFIRPASLGIRLAANMIAGHTILKVIAGFVAPMAFFGFIPLAFLVVLTGFELFIAVLQAYIFTLLLCVYLNDAVNLH